jgi:anti-sigma regulatory factor (Ser/Thr protein kinase)
MNDATTDGAGNGVELRIPASASYLRLARLAAADVAARSGWNYEDIDDLRIAVDELCYAIGAGSESGWLTLRYVARERHVEVVGTGTDTGVAIDPGELSEAIVSAVVDEFDLDREAARFRLVKRG